MPTIYYRVLAVCIFTAISACGRDNPGGKVQTQPDQVAKTVATTSTKQQWDAAVESVLEKDVKRTDENGVSEFLACFKNASSKCTLAASGRRDGFRKVQFFTDHGLIWDESGAEYVGPYGKPFLSAYVSLRDCGAPHLILKPIFRGRGWLFVEQIAIMSNGTIIFERTMKVSEVNRETSEGGVIETAHLILDEREIKRLRDALEGQQVLIRMTGQKGYVGIDPKATKQFVRGFLASLKIHDAMLGATSRLGAVSDPMCPA